MFGIRNDKSGKILYFIGTEMFRMRRAHRTELHLIIIIYHESQNENFHIHLNQFIRSDSYAFQFIQMIMLISFDVLI